MKILKPLLLLLILFTVSKITHAQNLINNPSFEEVDQSCGSSPNYQIINDGCFNIPIPGIPGEWSWGGASGKPSGANDGNCEGNYSAVFAANNHIPILPVGGTERFLNGSSIFYNFPDNLEPGNYTLSFCHEGEVESTLNTNLAVKLAKGLENVDPQVTYELYYEAYDDQDQGIPRSGITTQDIGPDVPVLHHVNQPFFASFTIEDNQNFDQLWFYGIPSGEGQSKVCIDDLVLIKCEEDISCEENLNLTSCSLSNKTGYIDLWCGEGNSYSVESPQDSDPLIYNCDGHLLITNATAGTYTIFIENINGCRYSRTYEVIENCCTGGYDCLPPENLSCFTFLDNTTLNWSPVAGAIGYELYYYEGECGGPIFPPESILLTGTSINRNEIDARSFEWAVRTVCANETLSAFSPIVCFDIDACASFSEGFSESENGNNSANQKAIIFPNPNDGNFTLELSDYQEKDLNSTIKIFNQTGVLVFQKKINQIKSSLDLKGIPSGVYLLNIQLDNQMISEKFIVQ